MITTATSNEVQFHTCLNVFDLSRSVDFYRILLGAGPAKRGADYAQFDLINPPLVLTLIAKQERSGGTLHHLGLCVADSAALVNVQRRLEEAGVPTQRQDGVECCYGRQTKFWVTDPDRNLWEIYVFEEDLDHSGFEDSPRPTAPTPDAATWTHRLTDGMLVRIPHGDASLDEVWLAGTFNASMSHPQPGLLLAEAARVLKPDGKLVVHALVSREPPGDRPPLSGLAALVQYIPAEADVLAALRAAGFAASYYEKLGDMSYLSPDGVDLREMRLWAWRPEGGRARPVVGVLYKGPFDRVVDDGGTVYRRGERVEVPSGTAAWLRSAPAASQFVFFPAGDH